MTLTKERLQKLIRAIDCENYDEEEIVGWVNSDEVLELARIALAALTAEPVAMRWRYLPDGIHGMGEWNYRNQAYIDPLNAHHLSRQKELLFTAPPAPVVPGNRAITQHFDTIALETAREIMCDVNRRHELLGGDVQLLSRIQCRVDEACRAAMLQGAEPVKKECRLPEDFDFDHFNDPVWFEAIIGLDNMYDPVTRTLATLALELNRKLDKPELTVWYGSMPETNGKTNWTAILHRKGERLSTGITVDCSEYPDRVRYEADRMRHLIGELDDEPDILAYDADAHSGYAEPVSQPYTLPLDYLQGHKDGLEWAARLAEANHPQTGDWLYDDPLELAKAIRKGPDMPEADGNSAAIPDDVRRMDWLVSKTVDVREPMVYGSHSLFWSQTITDEEDDYHATKLREQIDAAMAAENAAAPQQEVKP